jgi:predicted  nucleic acid-binding Zn-ribbon protein
VVALSLLLPSLAALIELQSLDTAIEAARKQLGEMPGRMKAAEAAVHSATVALDAAKATMAESTATRRQLEKDVAAVDTRLARFEEHKAAVKTNEQFHALQHEMQVGIDEKAALEEKVLVMMMEGDELAAKVKAAEAVVASAKKDAEKVAAAIAQEKAAHDAALEKLTAERTAKAATIDKKALTQYETLLKGRRGVAVAQMVNGSCVACHVRVRPTVEQAIKRNDGLVQCDSCQRLLYFVLPPAAAAAPDSPGPSAS